MSTETPSTPGSVRPAQADKETVSTTRRSQADRRAETERKLLAAATRLIANRGSRGFSLEDVGREAGYSRGIVNHQFGTKLAMLKAVVISTQAAFRPDEAHETGLDRLLAAAAAYVQHLHDDEPAGQAALLLWTEAAGSQPEFKPFFLERDDWFRSELTGQLEAGRRDGTVRSDVDPEAAAVSIVGMLRGIGLQLLLNPSVADLASLKRQTVEILRRGVGVTTDSRG